MSKTIQKSSLNFLKTLAKNNNREWFNDHKDMYLAGQANMVDFAGALLAEMNKHDDLETASGKDSLFRIYRDVRFSKEKTPYNTHWNGSFRRATKKLRGGYYFHIELGNTFVAGGFFGPNADDLKRIRQDMTLNYADWKSMLANKTLIKTFGGMTGDQLLSAPRGYDKNDPAIDLLRYKQFLLRHSFTDEEVLAPGFVAEVNRVFKNMRPFLDFMSEVLTTDANGISIVD